MEIEVRDAGGYPEKEIGKTLMFKAFAPGGPLAKASDTKAIATRWLDCSPAR